MKAAPPAAITSTGRGQQRYTFMPHRLDRAVDQRTDQDGSLLIGWREWLALPELGVISVKAKIDTGARSSSLHVEHQEEFIRDGRRWVRFELLPTSRRRKHPLICEAPVVDERAVTDSGGSTAMRLFIRTLLAMGGQTWPIEINLTNRRSMMFPMLLGRTAMRGRVRVDPSLSFVLGRARRRRVVKKDLPG